jgi:hypothetical protein
LDLAPANKRLFVVPTISFRLLYGLLIVGHRRRQILWFGVTAHPTGKVPEGTPSSADVMSTVARAATTGSDSVPLNAENSLEKLASLDAVLSELAKLMMQAGAQFRFFDEKTLTDYHVMIDYLTTQADWADHFFGHKTDRTQIEEVKAMVTDIGQRGSRG